MVDLALYSLGETASPLDQFVQEVDILMTSESTGLLTDRGTTSTIGLERVLFKHGVGAAYVENEISNAISANTSQLAGIEYEVHAKFVGGQHAKDILLIDIQVTYDGRTRSLAYSVQ